jgi:hypothetical protein
MPCSALTLGATMLGQLATNVAVSCQNEPNVENINLRLSASSQRRDYGVQQFSNQETQKHLM